MIDISQINLNIYSKDELLNFSNSGILFCGDMDLTEFVSKIMEGIYSQEELDRAVDETGLTTLPEKCDACNGTDICIKLECHNSSCGKYSQELNIYEGWNNAK